MLVAVVTIIKSYIYFAETWENANLDMVTFVFVFYAFK